MAPIEIVPYDPNWPVLFGELRDRIWPAISDLATSIEHVGSTSVPGLPSKPVIDLDIVIPTEASMPATIARLATLGYVHLGNLGVEGREAFLAPHSTPRHHLYCCPSNALALRNHLALRDHLRANPQVANDYGRLKQRLAEEHAADIVAYTVGKTEAILNILEAAGLKPEELETIQRINRQSRPPVEIVSYDPSWPAQFETGAMVLRHELKASLRGPLEHVGSTAVPGLAAKPVVDMMAGVLTLDASRPAIAALVQVGYCYSTYNADHEHWLCKPSLAYRTHHLHLVPVGTAQWRRTLAFRDYLRAYDDVAAEYQALKHRLAREHRLDREAYTQAKSPFIDRITDQALHLPSSRQPSK